MRKFLEFLWSFFMFLFLSKLQCAFVWDICNPLNTCKTIYHFEFVIWMFNVSCSLWINWKKVCHMEALMCNVVCNGNFWITTTGCYNNQQNCRKFKYFDSKPPHIYLPTWSIFSQNINPKNHHPTLPKPCTQPFFNFEKRKNQTQTQTQTWSVFKKWKSHEKPTMEN